MFCYKNNRLELSLCRHRPDVLTEWLIPPRVVSEVLSHQGSQNSRLLASPAELYLMILKALFRDVGVYSQIPTLVIPASVITTCRMLYREAIKFALDACSGG